VSHVELQSHFKISLWVNNTRSRLTKKWKFFHITWRESYTSMHVTCFPFMNYKSNGAVCCCRIACVLGGTLISSKVVNNPESLICYYIPTKDNWIGKISWSTNHLQGLNICTVTFVIHLRQVEKHSTKVLCVTRKNLQNHFGTPNKWAIIGVNNNN
jgi:hypothetical protein